MQSAPHIARDVGHDLKIEMRRNQQLAAAITYVLGMLIILWEVFSDSLSYMMISLGVLFIILSWIICLVNAAKQKPFNLLWFWFIFFVGAIGIPAYLSSVRKK